MRKFQVTVNGNTYEVEVEEIAGGSKVISAPVQAVQAAPIKKAAPQKPVPAKKPSGSVGATKITAPMQGKIVDVKVNEGQSINEGDVVAILEAMKMENEVVAPKGGTVSSVNVSAGQSVQTGDLIVSLN